MSRARVAAALVGAVVCTAGAAAESACPTEALDHFILIQYQRDHWNTLGTQLATTEQRCALLCVHSADCAAFNFRPTTAECELKTLATPDVTTHFNTNWAYYRRILRHCGSTPMPAAQPDSTTPEGPVGQGAETTTTEGPDIDVASGDGPDRVDADSCSNNGRKGKGGKGGKGCTSNIGSPSPKTSRKQGKKGGLSDWALHRSPSEVGAVAGAATMVLGLSVVALRRHNRRSGYEALGSDEYVTHL